MNSFSLIYEITRPITMPAIRIFYKRIQISNLKHLSKKGPVFICSNHVNAFMDPISIQLHTNRQIFSLARGDAFKKPFMRWLLTQWKLIPIYRLSEGAENLGRNEETFLTCSKVLSKGNALVIYPEAICVQERRLRKLKKGAARIAFGVEEQMNFGSNLVLLPVGLNYSAPKKFRSNLFMNFGEPIETSKYAELYKLDKAKALNELTAELEQAMKKLVVNIQHKENDRLVEDIYLIYKEQLMIELGLDPLDLEDDFRVSCDIANAVNYFQVNQPQLVEEGRLKMNVYTDMLRAQDIPDHLLTAKGLQSINGLRVVVDILTFIICMPLFLAGLIMNYPPYKLGHVAADKLAKEVEFHASVNMTVGWFSWIAYYAAQLIIVGLFSRSWLILGLYALLVPLTGLYVLGLFPLLKEAAGRRKLFGLMKRNKAQFENMVRQRAEVIDFFEKAKVDYCRYIKSLN